MKIKKNALYMILRSNKSKESNLKIEIQVLIFVCFRNAIGKKLIKNKMFNLLRRKHVIGFLKKFVVILNHLHLGEMQNALGKYLTTIVLKKPKKGFPEIFPD